jgi:hypothetical protein
MMRFNPLEYPICLAYPRRMAATFWLEHIPFAMFLMDVMRPGTFVELGTYYGMSYCAFCQAAKELDLDIKCYAIDTWQGDPHNGPNGPDVLADLRAHHDLEYGSFSRLVPSTFDAALPYFPDRSIDLLHIDGYHTYEAVKHDYESWLPKMSERGVVLFHDTNVRENNFGVWKLWSEVQKEFPYFEFYHGYGLGVLFVGQTTGPAQEMLTGLSDDETAAIREFFQQMGSRLTSMQETATLRERNSCLQAELRQERIKFVPYRVERLLTWRGFSSAVRTRLRRVR